MQYFSYKNKTEQMTLKPYWYSRLINMHRYRKYTKNNCWKICKKFKTTRKSKWSLIASDPLPFKPPAFKTNVNLWVHSTWADICLVTWSLSNLHGCFSRHWIHIEQIDIPNVLLLQAAHILIGDTWHYSVG